jgi:DeoR/GlpR family transcriptional regulator of sugar metabolism
MTRNDDRRQRILDLIAGAGYESVGALASALTVSEMTIRRDLDHLEGRGLIRRTHGGAVSGQVSELSIDFRVRSRQHADAKARVARAACERVGDGQIVYLDAGTTVMAMADGLAGRRDLTVVTPSLALANGLAPHAGISVILLGGAFRPDLMSVVGPLAEQTLASFHLDLAVLGTGGFHPERGLTHSTMEEIPLKRLAARLADRVVVVATREKLGRSGLIYFLGREDIDEVLIDTDLGAEAVGAPA